MKKAAFTFPVARRRISGDQINEEETNSSMGPFRHTIGEMNEPHKMRRILLLFLNPSFWESFRELPSFFP